MSSILLGLVYLAVVLAIFWSVYAERLPEYRERGPFAIRGRPSAPAAEESSKGKSPRSQ